MSVHQLTAANILRVAINAIKFGKPKFIHDILMKNPHRTRNKDKLLTPRCRLNLSTESFHNQAVRLINMLPKSIIDESSLMIRKRLIKVQ